MRNYNKYKKYNKRKRILNSPLSIILAMLAIIVTMAIGYASLNDVLKIIGTAKIATFTITYNLNGGTNVTNTISFAKGTKSATTSFTGLNIQQDETFTITSAENFFHNNSLTFNGQTITVYLSN